MPAKKITINRAPVPTLWASVVAERLRFDRNAALTLGKAVAGLNPQAKGWRLGIFKPPKLEPGEKPKKRGLCEEIWIDLCGRAVPAKSTKDGFRAVVGDKPIDPDSVAAYLNQAFGDDLPAARKAMTDFAKSYDADDLANGAFGLYERFRPKVARGKSGWGQKGELVLHIVQSLGGHI